MSTLGAIVLAGGRSSRMGTDKLVLQRDGRSLLQRCCDAVAPYVRRIIVAGPDRPGTEGVTFVVEDPPFGGPVAGIAAALPELPPGGHVFLLAGDLANPVRVVETLVAHRTRLEDCDGAVLEDADGWPQYLAGLYRIDSLREVAAKWPGARDMSVRRFLGHLDCVRVPVSETVAADIDTPEQAREQGVSADHPDTF